MSWKSEKNTFDTLFDATETKYLGSYSKSRIHKEFSLIDKEKN